MTNKTQDPNAAYRRFERLNARENIACAIGLLGIVAGFGAVGSVIAGDISGYQTGSEELKQLVRIASIESLVSAVSLGISYALMPTRENYHPEESHY